MANDVTKAPLAGIKLCVFDAYGTLFGFASGRGRAATFLATTPMR
jgi:hypothetical protein